MDTKEKLIQALNAAKKEVDRLETRRSEDLADSINYVENELKIQFEKGKIAVLEELMD